MKAEAKESEDNTKISDEEVKKAEEEADKLMKIKKTKRSLADQSRGYLQKNTRLYKI